MYVHSDYYMHTYKQVPGGQLNIPDMLMLAPNKQSLNIFDTGHLCFQIIPVSSMACMGNRFSCPLVYVYVRPTVETLRYSNYKILSQMVRKRRQTLCKDEIRGNQQGSARLLQ